MKKKNHNAVSPPLPLVKPQICHDAVVEWAHCVGKIGRSGLTEKAKAHLVASGWKIFYKAKTSDRFELRYESPAGKVHYSLRTACQTFLQESELPLICWEATLKPEGATPKTTDTVVVEALPVKTRKGRKKKAEIVAEEPEAKRPRKEVSVLPGKTRRGTKKKAEVALEEPEAKRPRKVLSDLKRLYEENNRCRNATAGSSDDKNNDECSVCCIGGDLVMCDGCPAAFHAGCVGLGEVGDGDWFCPSCLCVVCGVGMSQGEDFAKCAQCRQRCHYECAKNSEEVIANEKGDLFCNEKCGSVFLGIGEIAGKEIVVGPRQLTWTLLKSCSAFDVHWQTRNYRQHKKAVEVMHECFESSHDPEMRTDTVDNVIFNRLRKFEGFYTVILERNDEVISCATVRVHNNVAEVPLVGTKFKHWRLGMCRTMMDELEKQLVNIGVEKLVLPSAQAAFEAWTKLGFSKMTTEEYLSLVKHDLWNFAETIKCHKQLKKHTACAEAAGFGNSISTVTHDLKVDASQETRTTSIDYKFESTREDDSQFLTWYNKSGAKQIHTSGSKQILAL